MTSEKTSVGGYVVEPHDHALRWRVTSATRPDIQHVVDVGAFKGNGACSCENFDFRMRPHFEAGTIDKPMRCAHILAARHVLLDAFIETLSRGKTENGN